MRRSRFSAEQIVAVLKPAELGMAVPELIRKVGISEQTFYRLEKAVRMGCCRFGRHRPKLLGPSRTLPD